MKAILSKEVGGPDSLVLENMDIPALGKSQLLVSVKAVGINFPDVLIIQDLYQFKPQRPFAPGGEFSGEVKAVGEGVSGFSVGDKVMASTGWGAMAEEVLVDAQRCIPMPDGMPFDEAAAFIMTYGTSYYALKDRGHVKSGDKLLVFGAAGGVGLAAVELGKAMGAEVIAAASSQEKVDLAISKGASSGLVYPKTLDDRAAQKELSNQIKAVSDGGVDVVYDAIGGAYAEPAIRAMNWEGRFLVVGFPAGIPSIPLNLTLLKSCQIVGVFWGAAVQRDPDQNRQNMMDLFRMYAESKIRPHISAHFPLEQAGEAIKALAERRATGKVVVTL